MGARRKGRRLTGEVVYVCAAVTKRSTLDLYEAGEMGESTYQMLDQDFSHIRGATFRELAAEIVDFFSLTYRKGSKPFELKDEQLPDATVLIYARLEREDGEPPTPAEKRAWKKDKFKLYHAEYEFRVERQTIEPVPLHELAAFTIGAMPKVS
jgi:hypothetical protein